MTDIQLSELTQAVVDGQEDPGKALDIVWKIKAGNPYAKKCWNKILEILTAQRENDLAKWKALNSQTPIKPPYKTDYKSQWVEATDGFNYTSSSLDNQKRNYRNSIEHF